jgi:hypothetical protein
MPPAAMRSQVCRTILTASHPRRARRNATERPAGWAGEFGRAAEAAEMRVILAFEKRGGLSQQFRGKDQIARLARV